jgi:hypothetical protein
MGCRPHARWFLARCVTASHSYLPALHELDHLAVWPGYEGNPDFDQRISAELSGHGLDARLCAAGKRTGVGSVGIGDAQAEMQYCALDSILVLAPSATFGLDCRGLAKNLDVSPIASVQEGGAIDAARNRKREMDAKTQSLGIGFDRCIEVDRADGDVMEARWRGGGLHWWILHFLRSDMAAIAVGQLSGFWLEALLGNAGEPQAE